MIETFTHAYSLNINDRDEIIKVIVSCNSFFENKLHLKLYRDAFLFQNIIKN